MPHETIAVTFIDEATSGTIATVDLPVANLPDTFERETTLHLGDAHWSVMHAEPRTKAGFAEVRQAGPAPSQDRDGEPLRHPLQPAFDLRPDSGRRGRGPSRKTSSWPRTTGGSSSWSPGRSPLRRRSRLPRSRRFTSRSAASVGWKEIHVRKRPDPPIAATLRREDINKVFGDVTFHRVCFGRSQITSGFSFRAGDLHCYGIEEDGSISVLGIAQQAAESEVSKPWPGSPTNSTSS